MAIRDASLVTRVSLALFLLSSTIPAAAETTIPGYFTLSDYLQKHPEQNEISARFAEIVRGPAVPLEGTSEAKASVYIVYPGLQVSDYWRRSVDSFHARLAELGIEIDVENHFTKPGTELRLQSGLINQGLAGVPDYMVFTLDALRHRGMIERVMANGTTKVILQNITTPMAAFEPQQPFMYVGFDHAVGTRLLADKYKSTFPEGANYAILFGPQGYVSTLRGGTFRQEMSEHPNTKLLSSYYVNFDRQRAYNATKEIIRNHPDLDFIYACSTDIALGAIDALKEAGKINEVLVNGWGGGSSELAAIESGELAFTVMRMNDDNGVAMAEAIKFDLAGIAKSHAPTVYSGDFELVDQKTSPEKLKELQDYAFRYSR